MHRGALAFFTVLCWALALVSPGGRSLRAQDVQSDGRLSTTTIRADRLISTSDLAYGSVVLLSLLQLEPIENFDAWTSRELTSDLGEADTWARWGGRRLGSGGGGMAVAAAPLVYGVLVGDSRARSLGLRSLESLYTAAFFARVLKLSVGRARPSPSSDPDEFMPFNGDPAFHSFPSGHATRVFAVAATFARELGDDAPWVPYVAYSIATWAATTRVMDRAHWVTDIAAGAALGVLASSFVDRFNRLGSGREGLALNVLPLDDGGAALGLTVPVR